MQNRRQFLGGMALVAASPAALLLEGCPSSATVINDLELLVQEGVNLLVVIDPGVPYLSTIQAAVAKFKLAVAAFKTGGPVANVISTINVVIAVMEGIPVTAAWAELAAIIVAGATTVLGLMGVPVVAAQSKMRVAGVVGLGGRTVKSAADSVAQWNEVCKSNPALGAAKIGK